MLYRIDYDHFLLHMIDHFTYDELMHMYYVIISSKIMNGNRSDHVTKCGQVYPPYGLLNDWYTNQNLESFQRGYRQFLDDFTLSPIDRYVDTGEDLSEMDTFLWRYFIAPLKAHQDIMFVCDKDENMILDILFEYVHDKTEIEVIDLNKLFTDGQIGPLYLDWDEIHDKGVRIGRAAVREGLESQKRTKDGRDHLLKVLSDEEKKRELKLLGYTVKKSDRKDLTKLLGDAWDAEFGSQ